MDKIENIFSKLEDYGIFIGLLIAGFFGGIASLRSKEKLTSFETFITVCSGPLFANYLTPVLYAYIPISEDIQIGIGFMVGYTGIEGVQTLWKAIKNQIVNNSNKDE